MTTFSSCDVITRAQTEIRCELLKTLPDDGTPVLINKFIRFLNNDSLLVDGYLVETVRLVKIYEWCDYGHDVELTIRRIDYESEAMEYKDFSDIDETSDVFEDKPETFILGTIPGSIENLRLLSMVYTEATTPEKIVSFELGLPEEAFKEITDSLLLDSDTLIAKGTTSKGRKFNLFVDGDIRVEWNDQIYKTPSQFPKELVEVIREHQVDNHLDAKVINNNWYELTVYSCDGKVGYSDYFEMDLNDETEESLRSSIEDFIKDVL